MADTTRYVNIASSAGGDGTTNGTTGATRAYASLAEAETALQGTVGAGDRVLIYCDDGAAGADTTVVNIAGWTITGELHIIGNSGGDNASYDGTAGSGYRITGADIQNGIIDVDEDNVFFDGFELYFTGGNAYTYYDQACIKPTSNCNLCTVQNMLMWSDSTSHSTHGIYKDRSGGDVTCENNVVFGMGTAAYTAESSLSPYLNQDWIITNCTIYDCGWDSGYLLNGGAIHAQCPSGHDVSVTVNHSFLHANGSAAAACGLAGGGADPYAGNYNITNFADTDNVPGANSSFSVTFTTSTAASAAIFTNLTGGSEDFHLTDHANNVALDFSSGAGTFTSTDLEGTTRSTVPDVGAYQTSTAAANHTTDIPKGSLTASGKVPGATATENHSASIPAGSLSVSANVPTAQTTEANFSAVPVGSLAATPSAPTATTTESHIAAIPAAFLTATGQAPTAETTEHHQAALPAGSLSVSPQVPTAETTEGDVSSIPLGTLTATGQAPGATTTEHHQVAIPIGTLSASELTPSAVATGNNWTDIPAGSLNATENTPTAETTEGDASNIPVGTLDASELNPGATTTEHNFASIQIGLLTIAGLAPTTQAFPPVPTGTWPISKLIDGNERWNTRGKATSYPFDRLKAN